MLNWLKNTIIFNPVWLCMHPLSIKVKKVIGFLCVQSGESWLDVGCGLRPYESCFHVGSYVDGDIKTNWRDAYLKELDRDQCYLNLMIWAGKVEFPSSYAS